MKETAKTGERSISSRAFSHRPQPLGEDCLRRLDSYALGAGAEAFPASRRSESWFLTHGAAVAATAAGIGMLATAPPAEAGIIYTPANIVIVGNSENSATRFTPISVGGAVRFSFGEAWTEFGDEEHQGLSELPQPGNALIVGPLARGYQIGPGGNFNFGRVVLAYEGETFNFGSRRSGGPWIGAPSAYLGLQFQIDGQAHFGWVALTAYPNGLGGVVTGYAYETIANEPIAAGQTSTPEPGTLGLLALGSLGLGFWRRKRSVSEAGCHDKPA